jgi:hypothetical protein
MAETHSKGEQRHRPLAAAVTDGRSAMSRASDGRPFKPYVYGGGDREPGAVAAARERHRALNDRTEAAQRQRERDESRTAPMEADSDEIDEAAAARDRYQAAMAAVPESRIPEPPPATAASRCKQCGYLTTAAGHRVMCDE